MARASAATRRPIPATSAKDPLLAVPDDKQIGADSVRHAAVLLGRVAMSQMHLEQKAAAAKLRRTFDQNAMNLVAPELRLA
ncbi:MAG: hypothetical protein KBA36_11390 [Thermomonas sp.]|nr:hypothetical protein [Thermomonas sp.]